MGNSHGRLHLLLLAFALFFGCLNGRGPAGAGAGPLRGIPEAQAWNAPPAAGDTESDDGRELNRSFPPDRTIVRISGPLVTRASRLSEAGDGPAGRIVGYGETPPPRRA